MKKLIHITLLILWLLLIFSFSNESGTKSTETSDTVTIKLVSEESDYYPGTTKIVRKLAHMSEFAILTLLVYLVINDFSFRNKYLLTLMFALLFCTLDEIHQLFIPLRTGTFVDVTIDLLGILIMLCLIIKKKETSK